MAQDQPPVLPLVNNSIAKGSAETTVQQVHDNVEPKEDEAQHGVRGIEAIATIWSKTTLILVFVFVWIIFFVLLMQQASGAALLPYVTSSFQQHSLTPTVGIISSIFNGICTLTMAKIIDIFGRQNGYAISLTLATLGLVMMAATNSVEMYAAAQVFYTVGFTALQFTVSIIVADASSLRNRGVMTALTASPNIITTWLGGPISEAFLKGPGWAWCYGLFAIMLPVVCAPLLVILFTNYRRAKKQGIMTEAPSVGTPGQAFLYYCREFDAVGLFLLSSGLAMFLLPFNLYSFQPEGWKSPLVIGLLVAGIVVMASFVAWERFFAPKTFIPFELLSDRNVMGACILGATLFISFTCWNSLFGSFLQVVNCLSVTEASYVAQIYNIGGTLFAILAGVVIRYTGRFKGITLYGAIPVYTLFMGLMIHFRTAGTGIGFIIMCQIFLACSSGVMTLTPAIAAMSVSTHQHIAVVMAMVNMVSSMGAAVGYTAAGAIWQSVFPVKLAEYLPVEELENLMTIYGVIDVQLSYPEGSPARLAIQRAYADAQSMMLTAGTVVWVVGFVAVAFWRDIDVRTIKQVKGLVV
ncbi:siderophore iron transporter mirB [Plectosphaerella cucumerina]|uniref:Siderophore iron transporter mirB n=1 Tax=Plectosphaerella cucumerina TaxID=40658 RepID=A0A8K0TR23_9PEZI|nr:siderophore iron transporter mirB [Plectosphaerella cucumerina]